MAATTAISTAFFTGKVKKMAVPSRSGGAGAISRASARKLSVLAAAGRAEEPSEISGGSDRWGHLVTDTSDDQQDITRGKELVDSLFQGPIGDGTHIAVMSSYDYLSQGFRAFGLDNTLDGFYIAPAFMDKLVTHIVKNYMSLPNIKVPLILGIWGGKGQGKSFQCELVFRKLGINPIVMSAGELESGNAGEPAKLLRQRYREAADVISKKGKMCCLFINDLDAGAGRLGGTTQYTVNNQMVNATLMNIADNPTNVQLPGMYNKQENARVPIIVTGNDFSTLYAPLIRDGRMDKFYWAPTRDDRIGIAAGIFRTDKIPRDDVVKLVDTFPGQSIDFFGAVRARVYDDEVRQWVAAVGVENVAKKLVNAAAGSAPTFEQPKMSLEKLVEYGNMLVVEQENVKRVQLADKYLSDAALGDANADAINSGTFYGKEAPPPTVATGDDSVPVLTVTKEVASGDQRASTPTGTIDQEAMKDEPIVGNVPSRAVELRVDDALSSTADLLAAESKIDDAPARTVDLLATESKVDDAPARTVDLSLTNQSKVEDAPARIVDLLETDSKVEDAPASTVELSLTEPMVEDAQATTVDLLVTESKIVDAPARTVVELLVTEPNVDDTPVKTVDLPVTEKVKKTRKYDDIYLYSF